MFYIKSKSLPFSASSYFNSMSMKFRVKSPLNILITEIKLLRIPTGNFPSHPVAKLLKSLVFIL